LSGGTQPVGLRKEGVMSPRRKQEELSEERRREIYQALADEQDLYEFTSEQAR
jgi:hypothetical protein